MKQADPSLAQAVERLLAFEADGGEGLRGERGAAALARIHERLQRQLSTVVGELGFQALFARALKLTGRAFSTLAEANRPGPNEGALNRLCDHLNTQSHDMNAAIICALVTNFVNLLSTFIGEGLTLKLLHNAWPEVLPEKP